ncbi:DUF1427 family protein [Rhodococcus sp. X156]|uniref:DUF1427 family protein n=1 Tax=Rhodococcus sp. X156 TaxID=2499145 RepID=UPI000FD97F0E|nr:DUF1427 family protein [Rhodococcus sp. X156]
MTSVAARAGQSVLTRLSLVRTGEFWRGTAVRYVGSALVGILAGIIYRSLDIRSPAPPWVALVGLVGILLGEYWMGTALRRTWPWRRGRRIEVPTDES